MWYDSEIIDPIFAVIFLVLFFLNLYNIIKHGCQKRSTWIGLLIFDVIRVAGNIILLVAYIEAEHTSNASEAKAIQNLYTSGFILQGVGYSFLFGSLLRFYDRAIDHSKKDDGQKDKVTGMSRCTLIKASDILHISNIVATILLIVGLMKSTTAFVPGSSKGISDIAKIGSYIYCFMTVGAILLISVHTFIRWASFTTASHIILTFCLLALIPMSARVSYATYRWAGDKIIDYNIWVHLVLNNIAEALTVIIWVVLGFYLQAKGGDDKVDDKRDLISVTDTPSSFQHSYESKV